MRRSNWRYIYIYIYIYSNCRQGCQQKRSRNISLLLFSNKFENLKYWMQMSYDMNDCSGMCVWIQQRLNSYKNYVFFNWNILLSKGWKAVALACWKCIWNNEVDCQPIFFSEENFKNQQHPYIANDLVTFTRMNSYKPVSLLAGISKVYSACKLFSCMKLLKLI